MSAITVIRNPLSCQGIYPDLFCAASSGLNNCSQGATTAMTEMPNYPTAAYHPIFTQSPFEKLH